MWERKRLLISVDIRKYPIRYSLRYPIDKFGSITLFSSEDAFPNFKKSAKKRKVFINNSASKENENNVDATV